MIQNVNDVWHKVKVRGLREREKASEGGSERQGPIIE